MTLFLIILSVVSCLVVSFSVVKLNEAFDNQCILNAHLEFMEKTPVENMVQQNSSESAVQSSSISNAAVQSSSISNVALTNQTSSNENSDFMKTRECI